MTRVSNGKFLQVLGASPAAGVPIEVDVYLPDGVTMLDTLQTAYSVGFQDVLNDTGSGSFAINRFDPKATATNLAKDNIVKIKIGGVYRFAFVIEEPSLTVASPAGLQDEEWVIQGRGVLSLLDRVISYPEGWPTPAGSGANVWNGSGGGLIWQSVTNAQARGTIPEITLAFTAGADSESNPWTDSQSLSYHTGVCLLDQVSQVCALGACDVYMDTNLRLHAYVSRSRDWSSTVVLRQGRHIADDKLTSQKHYSAIKTRVLVEGAVTSIGNTTSPVGAVEIVTGLAETLIPGCSITVPLGVVIALGGAVGLSWDIWLSEYGPTHTKAATLRLRRSSITGAILATGTITDTVDSVAGNVTEWNGSFSDTAPTDGVYVLTVQETGNAAVQVWSATRTFNGGTGTPAYSQIIGDETGVLHREGYLAFTGSTDPTTLSAAGTAAQLGTISDSEPIKLPIRRGTGRGDYEPYVDYDCGDYVTLDVPGVYDLTSERIRSITVAQRPAGTDYAVLLDLNSIQIEKLLRLTKRLVASTGGTGSMNTGTVASALTAPTSPTPVPTSSGAGTPGTPGTDGTNGTNGTDGTNGTNGTNGVGVPAAGTTGQILAKNSNADYDTKWEDAPSGGSGIEITDGTHDVTGATLLTVTGGTVGGTTPNATLTVTGGGGSSVPGPLIPPLWRDSWEGYTVSASSIVAASAGMEWITFCGHSGFAPWYGWVTLFSNPQWIQVEMPTARVAVGYALMPWWNDDQAGRTPNSWTFEGSNNGSSWDTLDTQTGYSSWSYSWGAWLNPWQTYTDFPISNSASYKYYRLNITANNGSAYVGIGAMQVYGT